jgi:hypothetical protein
MINRRQFITASAVATVGATAGCSDIVGETPLGSEGNGAASGGVTALDSDGLLELLHEPGTYGDQDHYAFSVSSPAAIDAVRDALDDDVFAGLVTRARGGSGQRVMDAVGVDFWDVGTRYSAGPLSVLVGDFNRDDIWRRLQYQGLSYRGDYNGFALLQPTEGERQPTLALEGEGKMDDEEAPTDISRVIVGSPTEDTDSSTVVQAVIDVAAGDGDRYADAVDSVTPLVEGLGGGALMRGETFEAVTPDDGPNVDVAHETIPFNQQVSGTLSGETTASVFDQEYSFMKRYGFAASADSEMTITVSGAEGVPLGVLLFAGNGDEELDSANGQGQVELQRVLPEDGAYNFIVFDRDQVQGSSGTPRDYTVELSVEGGGVGGPESGVFEGEIARGTSLRFEGDNAIQRWVLLFETEPPMDGIDTWISENSEEGELFGPHDEVTQEQEGNRAIVEGITGLSSVGSNML